MGNRKRSINDEATRYFAYMFIVSIVLNVLSLIVSREYLGHLTGLISIIPMVMPVMFLNYIWSVFSMDKLYMHIISVAKKRIYFDIFIKWIVFYTLVFLTSIGSIIVSVDMNYIYENVNIKGLLVDVFLTYMEPISMGLFFSVPILLSKIFKIRFSILFIAFLAILPLVAQIKNVPYRYENPIEMYMLQDYREIVTKEEWSRGLEESEIKSEPWMEEEKISYLDLSIYTTIAVIGIGYCIKNIEKINLEEVYRPSKKRALYEKRWYDKWVK